MVKSNNRTVDVKTIGGKTMKNANPKAYIYTRVSTEMQVDGYSLSAQTDDIKKFAEFRHIQIVGEYCDEGRSGKATAGRVDFN